MKRYDDDRPQLLDEMLLPLTINRRIQGAVTSPDLPQIYFFTGPTGVGKTTAARIIVRVRLCEGRNPTTPDPCGRCILAAALGLHATPVSVTAMAERAAGDFPIMTSNHVNSRSATPPVNSAYHHESAQCVLNTERWFFHLQI
ncbi:MAG: hypothetical protein GY903_09775 [Fuerstiella sp.]|nr:hypothetical protein [Fuerstiella sp.]MCP4854768.1 hypothetical protein [Fuerstiella sp.]